MILPKRVRCRLLMLTLLLHPSSFPAGKQPVLTAAISSSLRPCVEEILFAFSNHYDMAIRPIYAATGKLVAQIRNGAAIDIFLSADVAGAESLNVWGCSVNQPMIFAYGSIVLWTCRPDIDISLGIDAIRMPVVRTVAMGNPVTTAYGKSARQLLESSALWPSFSHKCVFGESIIQAACYIASGVADIGFVAKAQVISEPFRNKGIWVNLAASSKQGLAQTVVLCKNATPPCSEAEALLRFLFDSRTRTILQKYGYDVP